MELKPPTRQQQKILDAAVRIHTGPLPDENSITYMARPLVQATLPHSDPGDVPVWGRVNGDLSLTIKPDWEIDPKTNQTRCVGIPYGTIPRLLLFWMTNEAIKTNSRRLELGYSLSAFMRELGLIPSGGRWGTIPRLRDQMNRLFRAKISFDKTKTCETKTGHRWLDMQVAPKGMMWWDDKKPEQSVLFESWIEITDDFFKAITEAPVPINIEAIAALQNSSMALDLYALMTFTAYQASRNKAERFISWEQLQQQLGTDYNRIDNLRANVKDVLKKIVPLYPGLRLGDRQGGLEILATSTTAVPLRASRRKPPASPVPEPLPSLPAPVRENSCYPPLSYEVVTTFRTRYPRLDAYACKEAFDCWLDTKDKKPITYGRAFLGFAKKWAIGKE